MITEKILEFSLDFIYLTESSNSRKDQLLEHNILILQECNRPKERGEI